MLISLHSLVEKYKITFTGILHIGAHECEEIVAYDRYLPRDKVVWIEAIPEKVSLMKEKYPDIFIEHAAVSNAVETVNFNVTNNGQSSSILELERHSLHYPGIVVVRQLQLQTTVTRDVVKKYHSKIRFNFLNLDIQGAELLALKGMEEYLKDVDYIYTEVNTAKLYKNCVLLSDMDEYLKTHGFHRVEISMTGQEWGDAFYIKSIR